MNVGWIRVHEEPSRVTFCMQKSEDTNFGSNS